MDRPNTRQVTETRGTWRPVVSFCSRTRTARDTNRDIRPKSRQSSGLVCHAVSKVDCCASQIGTKRTSRPALMIVCSWDKTGSGRRAVQVTRLTPTGPPVVLAQQPRKKQLCRSRARARPQPSDTLERDERLRSGRRSTAARNAASDVQFDVQFRVPPLYSLSFL